MKIIITMKEFFRFTPVYNITCFSTIIRIFEWTRPICPRYSGFDTYYSPTSFIP